MSRSSGLPSDEEKALTSLERAMELENNEEKLDEAVSMYQSALGDLMKIMRAEADASRKETLRAALALYMTRAEEAKAKLRTRPPSNGSSNNGSSSARAGNLIDKIPVVSIPRGHIIAADNDAKQRAARVNRPRSAAPLPSGTFGDGGGGGGKKAPRRTKPMHTANTNNNDNNNEENKESTPPSPAANIDPKLRSMIENEILDTSASRVSFADVAGLHDVKEALMEMVIRPALRPDIYTGLRQPPKGLLLYGPPGNGKTFIARAVASEAKCTFFAISAATIVSKFFGEGEKMVRALFAVARERAPSIIFIDEIDSILSKRSSEEHEASRRLKTEFLVQMDGAAPGAADRHVVVIAATNLPDQLDDAFVRRMPKLIYVPTPDPVARKALISGLLKGQRVKPFTDSEWTNLIARTDGYSSSDLTNLCRDAAMGPVRRLTPAELAGRPADQIDPISYGDFDASLRTVLPSVPKSRLAVYQAFADTRKAGATPPSSSASSGSSGGGFLGLLR